MSAAASRTILFKTRTTPVEILDAGEGYLFLNGNELFFKDGNQNTIKLNLSSVEVQTLAQAVLSAQKGTSSGVATLDTNGRIPLTQLPVVTTDFIGEGGTNKYHTDSRVLSTPLIGYTQGDSNASITATNTVLEAISILTGQMSVWQELMVTANLSSNSSTTFTNISQLGFLATAGKRYRIESQILFQSSATTTGLVLSMGTNTAAGELSLSAVIPNGADGTSATFSGWVTSFNDPVTATGVQATNTSYAASIEGIFNCSTSGIVYPQFRSEVLLSSVSVRAGSNLLVREF